MKRPWYHLVLSTHPLVILAAHLIVFILPLPALQFPTPTGWRIPYGVATGIAIPVGLFLLWLTALYWEAGRFNAARGWSSGRRRWVFRVAWVGLAFGCVFKLFELFAQSRGLTHAYDVLDVAEGLMVLLLVPALFASIVLASNELARFASRSRRTTDGRAFGYFFAIANLVFGAFFLWKRIKELRAATERQFNELPETGRP